MVPPFKKLVHKSHKLIHLCDGRTYHFSYILRRNKIISFGVNSYRRTSWLARKNRYGWSYCHSEIASLISLQFSLHKIKKTTLVNIRLSRDSQSLLLSKPCKYCLRLIEQLDFDEVWFSTEKGFNKL